MTSKQFTQTSKTASMQLNPIPKNGLSYPPPCYGIHLLDDPQFSLGSSNIPFLRDVSNNSVIPSSLIDLEEISNTEIELMISKIENQVNSPECKKEGDEDKIQLLNEAMLSFMVVLQNRSIQELITRELDTNMDYARWIFDAKKHGFVSISKGNPQLSLEMIQRGKTFGKADPLNSTILPGLSIAVRIIKGKILKWIDSNFSGQKEFVQINSLIRPEDTRSLHYKGRAVDIGITHEDVDEVIEVLDTLEPSKTYHIGLPLGGKFFPEEKLMETQIDKAFSKKEAKAVVSDGLRMGRSKIYNGNIEISGEAYTLLKDQTLKAKIEEMKKKSEYKTLKVFPDYPRHIHIGEKE